jgi:actin-like ATPase involved in cell morphogenesis
MDATIGSWALAIDFGTSYTSAALAAGDGVDLIDLHGDRRVPSLVFLDEDGRLLVGVLAANQSAGAPDRVERTPKARVGRSPILLLGGQAVPVVDAVGALVAAFVEEARRRRGGSAPSAVTFTHPVRWGEDRRQVLLDAAAAAGIDAESARLVEEPVAAAAAFRSERVRPGDLVAVYDLGGGTFDAAVLRATETGFVVAGPPGGDDGVGGEMFDERLLAHVGEQVAAVDPEGWQALSSGQERRWRRAHAQLHDQVRLAKETLSIAGQATVYVPGVDRDVLVTRGEFEYLIAADVERTLDLLDEVIRAAGATADELAAIYPVGGSSRIPLVANRLQEHYGDRVVTWDDPQAVVALGAARLARHHVELLGGAPEAAAPAPPPAAEPPPAPPPAPEPPPATEPAHATEPAPAVAPRPAPPRVGTPRTRRRRTPVFALAGVAAAAGIALAVVLASGDDDGDGGGSTSIASAPVTCPAATVTDLPGTIDRACFERWFERDSATAPLASDDADVGRFDAAEAFVERFESGFSMDVPLRREDCTALGCMRAREVSESDDVVWLVDTGMYILTRYESGGSRVLDVLFADPETEGAEGYDPVPYPWEPGDGFGTVPFDVSEDEPITRADATDAVDEYLRLYRDQDAEAIAALFTDDARYSGYDCAVGRGRSEIADEHRELFDRLDADAVVDGSLSEYGRDGRAAEVDVDYTTNTVVGDGTFDFELIREDGEVRIADLREDGSGLLDISECIDKALGE